MPEIISQREQMLRDILTTAFEGGCNYWMSCESVERADDLCVTKIVKPFDSEDEGNAWPDVTTATVELGIQRITGGQVQINQDLFEMIAACHIEVDACNIDSDGADVIVQVGLFNDIIYG